MECSSSGSFGSRSFSRSMTRRSLASYRKVCAHGAKCYRRNPEHLDNESHPADEDYLPSCRQSGVEPEFVSLRKLFQWMDENSSGKAKRESVGKVWQVIQRLGSGIGELDDAEWEKMDDDGNGHINFYEFVEYTSAHEVNLPLGLDSLLGNASGPVRCGVPDCSCEEFHPRRRRCKYGEKCFRGSNEDHSFAFCHPCDEEWIADVRVQDANMCRCGHKKKLHASAACGSSAVDYPAYWETSVTGDSKEFAEMVPISESLELARFQNLLDTTYSDVTTRDRVRHCPDTAWMVPRGFTLHSVVRNENSKLWRKYTIRKAEMQDERRGLEEEPDLEPYPLYDDVATSQAWADAVSLDRDINEWYLFHGTSTEAAESICTTDFKMRLAGSNTGTLYGRGSYLAESCTKADEYAADEGGIFTMLLCRVLGGRVRYTDERTPDPAVLTQDCVEGDFDCILGDRKKASGTYREFIIFDTENVYPEYIMTYERGEFFKSPSHP